MHIAEVLKGEYHPVNRREWQAECLGKLGLGSAFRARGERLKKCEAPLEGGCVGDGVRFHS